jgi:hypothetical protein
MSNVFGGADAESVGPGATGTQRRLNPLSDERDQ